MPEQARERETTDRKREVSTRGPDGGRKGRPNCSAAHEVRSEGSHQWVRETHDRLPCLQPIQGCPMPTNAAENEVRRSYQSIVINAPTQSGHTRARAAN